MRPARHIQFLFERQFLKYADPLNKTVSKIIKETDDPELLKIETLERIVRELHVDFEDIRFPGEANTQTDDEGRERDASGQLTPWGCERLRTYLDAARDYYDALSDMGDDEFKRPLHDERKKANEERDERQRRTEKMLPFNDLENNADYATWAREKKWTADEALALSFGKNPNKINWEEIKRYEFRSPFVRDFRKRMHRIERAIRVNELKDPIKPAMFLIWAQENDIECPPELIALLLKPGPKANTLASGEIDANDEIHHHTRHTYYAVLLGLAISEYGLDPGYDPDKGGSTAFAAITRKVKDAGLKVSVRTLREHTKEALAWAAENEIELKAPKRKASEPR